MPGEIDREGVWSVDFSLDGKSVITAGPDKVIMQWDNKSKKSTSVYKGNASKINVARFNENCKLIASGSDDGRVVIWDTRKGNPLKTIESTECTPPLNFRFTYRLS